MENSDDISDNSFSKYINMSSEDVYEVDDADKEHKVESIDIQLKKLSEVIAQQGTVDSVKVLGERKISKSTVLPEPLKAWMNENNILVEEDMFLEGVRDFGNEENMLGAIEGSEIHIGKDANNTCVVEKLEIENQQLNKVNRYKPHNSTGFKYNSLLTGVDGLDIPARKMINLQPTIIDPKLLSKSSALKTSNRYDYGFYNETIANTYHESHNASYDISNSKEFSSLPRISGIIFKGNPSEENSRRNINRERYQPEMNNQHILQPIRIVEGNVNSANAQYYNRGHLKNSPFNNTQPFPSYASKNPFNSSSTRSLSEDYCQNIEDVGSIVEKPQLHLQQVQEKTSKKQEYIAILSRMTSKKIGETVAFLHYRLRGFEGKGFNERLTELTHKFELYRELSSPVKVNPQYN